MDKKNTMLLTVIAVATLLVAVVGATFAYFTIDATNSSGTTAIQTTTGNTGTIVLTTVTNALQMHLTATDMGYTETARNYWATNAYVAANHRWETTAAAGTYDILNVKATNAESPTYNCTGTIKAVLTANVNNQGQLDEIIAADGQLVLIAGTGTTLANGTITIADLVDAGNTGETRTFTNTSIASSPTTGTDTVLVKAYLQVNNTAAEQDYLQDADFTINLTAPSFSCDVNATPIS